MGHRASVYPGRLHGVCYSHRKPGRPLPTDPAAPPVPSDAPASPASPLPAQAGRARPCHCLAHFLPPPPAAHPRQLVRARAHTAGLQGRLARSGCAVKQSSKERQSLKLQRPTIRGRHWTRASGRACADALPAGPPSPLLVPECLWSILWGAVLRAWQTRIGSRCPQELSSSARR